MRIFYQAYDPCNLWPRLRYSDRYSLDDSMVTCNLDDMMVTSYSLGDGMLTSYSLGDGMMTSYSLGYGMVTI